MEIINVTSWKEKKGIMTTGTRMKYWLEEPSEQKIYLFKLPKIDGEIYAEILAANLAKNIYRLRVPETFLGIKDDNFGVLSKNFVNTEENERFDEIVDYFGADFDAHTLEGYTVEKAYEIASEHNILLEFYEMCFFDSIIGNQDRHCENWGILYNSANQGTMAPLYDNGSSLLNGITDEKINKMSTDGNMLNAYVKRAESCFTANDKNKLKVDEFLSILYELNPTLYSKVLPKFYYPDYQAISDTIHQLSDIISNENRMKVLENVIRQKTLVLGNIIK